MRKITSKEQEERKRKRNQIVVSIILIAVMFFSVLSYSFVGRDEPSSGKIIYNGFEFELKNSLWILTIENTQFGFKYSPREIQNITGVATNTTIIRKISDYYGKPLYINSENNEAEIEIQRNFYYVTQRIQRACLVDENCYDKELPVKTCKDNFIMIKESNETKISQRGNCVFIQGQPEELTKLTDKFLFSILGVEK